MSYKSKLMLPILAVIAGVAASAFTVGPTYHARKLNSYIYQYNGAQTPAQRILSSNYTIVSSVSCTGSDDECAVTLNQDFGTHPDFSNGKVTFDANGMPDGGSAFVSNSQKNPTP